MTSRFRTFEVSDPRFERDDLRCITVQSPALGRRGDITLFAPPGVSAGRPLIILLHGVYGSHWSWTLSGGVHLRAAALIEAGAIPPCAIAMPSDGLWGDGSGYLSHAGGDHEAWIVDDVPAAVAEVLPAVAADGPLCLGGLSMGGYGAMRLGALHANRVAAVAAHSSVTSLEDLTAFVAQPLADYGLAPERSGLAEILTAQPVLPRLRFDCGTDDPLLASNRALHAALHAAGIEHEYEEFGGGHEWRYWEEHVAGALCFFSGIRGPKSERP